MLSWAARGGDAVCGKLVNEIVGIADVINDLYAGPRPMLSKSGSCGTTVGAGCSCHPTGCEYHRSTRVPLHPVWPRAASCTLCGSNHRQDGRFTNNRARRSQ